jgi:exosortase A
MSSSALASRSAARRSGVEHIVAGPELVVRPAESAGRRWTLQLALLASVLIWTVVWYWDTASSMALIWWRSDTFAHGMVVYPISLWLIWRKRALLEDQPVVPSLWVLALVAIMSFGWLLGDLGGVQAARHFCLVAMIALAAWAVLGTRVAYLIAFPLAFTLLAVPIGEFLLPTLIEQTADFTVGALRLSGIPIYREGNNFVIPSGSWSVVEACSGLRYLIASVMLGLLYAYLSYRSWRRIALFIIASVLVPIVANWIRAYMIVMIGHLSGMKYAVGADHLLYGWVFFGIVMLILFWIGSHWREDLDTPRAQYAPVQPLEPARLEPQFVLAAAMTAVLVVIAPSYSNYVQMPSGKLAEALAEPAGSNGWTLASAEPSAFRPHFVGGRLNVHATYERGGHRVGLYIGYFVQQRGGAELITFGNTLIGPRDQTWNQVSEATRTTDTGVAEVVSSRLRSRVHELAVWHWFWTVDGWSANPRTVKLRQALDKLLARGDDAAVVVIYGSADGPAGSAEAALQAFAKDMIPSIATALNNARVGSEAGGSAQPVSGR